MKKSTKETLSLPFAEVEVSALKAAIVDKFDSVANFCRITKRDLQEVNVALRKKTVGNTELLESVFNNACSINHKSAAGYHFTESHKKQIKNALHGFGTITAFCQQYPQFSNDFISRITNRGLSRITKKVKALALILSVDLQSKQQ